MKRRPDAVPWTLGQELPRPHVASSTRLTFLVCVPLSAIVPRLFLFCLPPLLSFPAFPPRTSTYFCPRHWTCRGSRRSARVRVAQHALCDTLVVTMEGVTSNPHRKRLPRLDLLLRDHQTLQREELLAWSDMYPVQLVVYINNSKPRLPWPLPCHCQRGGHAFLPEQAGLSEDGVWKHPRGKVRTGRAEGENGESGRRGESKPWTSL